MTTTLTIQPPDGTRLKAWGHGDPDAPTIVCVHGWPDDHSVWDGVVSLLADRFHVVTFDNRGAGESEAPAGRSSYRLERLAADLDAVCDAMSPDRPVHLLGHDWGSILAWHRVTMPGAPARIASFTSISGPDLDLAGRWMRRGGRAAASQLVHSWYVMAFQLPVLPELAVRAGLVDRTLGAMLGEGAAHPSGGRREQRQGLQLYRANMLPRLARPRHRTTDVPVQVLTPQEDPAVTPALQAGAAELAASDLRIRAVPGSHWVPVSNPRLVAQLTASLVDEVEAR